MCAFFSLLLSNPFIFSGFFFLICFRNGSPLVYIHSDVFNMCYVNLVSIKAFCHGIQIFWIDYGAFWSKMKVNRISLVFFPSLTLHLLCCCHSTANQSCVMNKMNSYWISGTLYPTKCDILLWKERKQKKNLRRSNFQHLLLAMYIYIWMLIYHIRLQNDIVCLNLIWANINLALWTTMAGLSKPNRIDSGWSGVLLCDFLEVFE